MLVIISGLAGTFTGLVIFRRIMLAIERSWEFGLDIEPTPTLPRTKITNIFEAPIYIINKIKS